MVGTEEQSLSLMELDQESATRLAVAIVEQAISDFRKSQKRLLTDPFNSSALFLLNDCERFFISQWFLELSNLDGTAVINHLKCKQ